jgi:hypothetical protein
MFSLKKLLKPNADKHEITSLNLQIPDRAPQLPQQTGGLTPESLLAILKKKPAEEEVHRRAKLLRELNPPKALFFLVEPQNGCYVDLQNQSSKLLPLFSSPLAALDYLQTRKITSAGIAGFQLASLGATVERWQAAGIDSLIFDLCPRCAASDSPLVGATVTREELVHGWSIERAVRHWRGEVLVRVFGSLKWDAMRPQMRLTLEFLRDHVDCSVPYVHWLIALIAGMQGDEAGRLAATVRLEQFGPNFRGKTWTLKDKAQGQAWAQLWGAATMGLLATYGLLKTQQPPQKP